MGAANLLSRRLILPRFGRLLGGLDSTLNSFQYFHNVRSRLTIRLSGAAPEWLGMQMERSRGIRCSSVVRLS
jgi:hypothetical protein